jgi:hypothetical protein
MAGQSSMAPGGGQAGCAGGGQALADREHVHQRVRLPAVALLLVGPATVEVRDDPAVDHDADRRTELAAFGEVAWKASRSGSNRGSQWPSTRLA